MILNRDERSKKQAKVMVEQAKAEAESLLSDAEKKNADLEANTISEIKLASLIQA